LTIAESLSYYFQDLIEKMQVENVATFTPSARATRDFQEHHDLFMKRTVWHAPCSAWYTVPPYKPTTEKGKSPLLYPGSRIHMINNITHPRFEDWELTWLSHNRFNYWGNGFHVREFDGRDLTWYTGILDGKDEEPDFADIMATYDIVTRNADI